MGFIPIADFATLPTSNEFGKVAMWQTVGVEMRKNRIPPTSPPLHPISYHQFSLYLQHPSRK